MRENVMIAYQVSVSNCLHACCKISANMRGVCQSTFVTVSLNTEKELVMRLLGRSFTLNELKIIQ